MRLAIGISDQAWLKHKGKIRLCLEVMAKVPQIPKNT